MFSLFLCQGCTKVPVNPPHRLCEECARVLKRSLIKTSLDLGPFPFYALYRSSAESHALLVQWKRRATSRLTWEWVRQARLPAELSHSRRQKIWVAIRNHPRTERRHPHPAPLRLAQALSRLSGGWVWEEGLSPRSPGEQKTRSKFDRAVHARSFEITDRWRGFFRRFDSRHHEVWLVDDFVTTGETLRNAEAHLRVHGIDVSGAVAMAHRQPFERVGQKTGSPPSLHLLAPLNERLGMPARFREH